MKRLLTLMGIGTAAFLVVIASVKLGITQQEADAKLYLAQGLYDEAMQAYARSSLYGSVLKGAARLMGEFNAFLALVGLLFFGGGIYLKKWQRKSSIKQVRVTEEFK